MVWAGRRAAAAWSHPDPLHDALPVRDIVCFFAERTDLALDGVPMERPETLWSSPAEQQRRLEGDR